MHANRRFARRLLLVVCLGAGAVSVAGCTSSSHVVGPSASTTTAPSGRVGGASGNVVLPALVNCLKSQGVALAEGADAPQVRAVFVGLPLATQTSVFAACKSLLPLKLRLRIRTLIAGESSPTTSSSSAAP